jgi:peptidoglycan/LPS O-acetylase OafA/YrhL
MDDPHLASFLLTSIQFFLVGWLLADIYLVDWSSAPRTARGWDVVSVIGWPLLILGLVMWTPFRPIVAPWLAMALCVAAFRGSATRRLVSNRWITTIGGMCYSIYLTHFVVMLTVGRALAGVRTMSPELDLLVFGVLLVVPVMAVAVPLFVLVERPCMDPAWASRLYRRAMAWRRLEPIRIPTTAAPDDRVIVIPDAGSALPVDPTEAMPVSVRTPGLGSTIWRPEDRRVR